ncbi:MAG: leucine-rich repeat domain-containing protein [Polyangiales bacterium]
MKTLTRSNLSEALDLSTHPKLESLTITKGNTGLIDGYGGAKKLRAISFIECGLTEVPDLSAATSLRHLNLSMNYMLRDYGNLANLPVTELVLNGCDLKEVPESIAAIPDLRVLKMMDNFTLKSMDNLALLKQVQTLVLSRCRLSALPAGLAQMTSLLDLDFSRNSKLASLAGLNAPVLEKLMLDTSSSLTSLEGLSGAPKLKHLSLSASALGEVPPEILELKDLEELKLNCCPSLRPEGIACLSGLPKLKLLDLSDCQLEALPPSFSDFASSITILVGHNNFDGKPKLPKNVRLDWSEAP